jgi:hypothetical protein
MHAAGSFTAISLSAENCAPTERPWQEISDTDVFYYIKKHGAWQHAPVERPVESR